MIILKLFVFIIIILITCALDEENCENNLENALKKLERKIDNPPKYKDVPKPVDDLDAFIKKAASIEPNITALQIATDKLKAINNNVLKVNDKLRIVEEVKRVLEDIGKRLQDLKESRKKIEDANKECIKANSDMNDLRNIMNKIENAGKDIKDKLGKDADRIDKITNESIALMREVDGLKSFTDYQCDKRVGVSINQTLDTAERIVLLLGDMFGSITVPIPEIKMSHDTAELLEIFKEFKDKIKKMLDERVKVIKENVDKMQTQRDELELQFYEVKNIKFLLYYNGICNITAIQEFEDKKNM